MPVAKALTGEGPIERVLCDLVEEHGLNVLAVQLPPGTKSMPQQMLSLLRSCRGATIVYQDDRNMRHSMARKSGALRRSVAGLHSVLRQARLALAAGEAALQRD